jgi:GNAT superfamily N-acetyltransferase
MNTLFENNPFGQGLQVFAKSKNGQILGYISLFSVPFFFKKFTLKSAQLANTLVHKEMRRKGIFNQLYTNFLKSAKDQKYNFLYVFPNQYSLHTTVDKLGFKPKPLMYWKKEISRQDNFDFKFIYNKIEKFDKFILKNIENKDSKFLQIKDNLDYLNWRFQDIGEFFHYDLYKIMNDSYENIGIVVFKDYVENKIKYGQIIHAIFKEYDFDVLTDLINFYCSHHQNKGIFNLQMLFIGPPKMYSHLKSLGFSYDTKNRFLCYKTTIKEVEKAFKSDNIIL